LECSPPGLDHFNPLKARGMNNSEWITLINT
jgi:hypothetical protein